MTVFNMPMGAGRFTFIRFFFAGCGHSSTRHGPCELHSHCSCTDNKRETATHNATFVAFFFFSDSRKTLFAFSLMRDCIHERKMDWRNCFNWLDAVLNSQAAANAITHCMTACPKTHRLATFWSVGPPFSYPADVFTQGGTALGIIFVRTGE